MLFAYVNGVRSKAAKGLAGICKCCNDAVLPFCGTYLAHHWKHPRHSTCTYAGKGESEWHLNWKNRFPEDWQEVIFTDRATGERHVADVHTPNGVTLEFQNSPILPGELRQREAFYKKLVWVVNASGVDVHFASVAEKKIKALYRERHEAKRQLAIDTERLIETLESNKRIEHRSLESKQRSLDFKHSALAGLKQRQVEFETGCTLPSQPGKLTRIPSLREIQDGAYSNRPEGGHSGAYHALEEKIQAIENQMASREALSQDYLKGPDEQTLSKDDAFKLANAGFIEAVSFMKSSEIGTFFAKPEPVGQLQFLGYLTQGNSYTLFLDRMKLLSLISQLQEESKSAISSLRQDADSALLAWQGSMSAYYEEEIRKAEEEIARARQEYETASELADAYMAQCDFQIKALRLQQEEEGETLFSGLKAQADRLQALYKDQYRVTWKRRRDIWYDASACVFLDTGKELYRLEGEHEAKRYSYEAFTSHYAQLKG